MPKKPFQLISTDEREHAEARRFVAKWPERREGMSKTDQEWLCLCARRPYLIPTPKCSIGAMSMRDNLSAEERSKRLAELFAEYPDEAGELWQAVRREVVREITRKTKLQIARQVVRDFAAAEELARRNPSKEEWLKETESIKSPAARERAIANVENLFRRMANPEWHAKDVERHLEYCHGGDWSATVEKAIKAEQAKFSEKKEA